MTTDKRDKMFMYGGWALSFSTIMIGVSFIWPHIHTALLGICLAYVGVRIFNFSTFKEYKDKRAKMMDNFGL